MTIVVADTFNRTDGELVGDSTTTGAKTYGGSTGEFETDGSSLVYQTGATGNAAGAVTLPVGLTDYNMTFDVTLASTAGNNSIFIACKYIDVDNWAGFYVRQEAATGGKIAWSTKETPGAGTENGAYLTFTGGLDFETGLNITLEVRDDSLKIYPTSDSAQYVERPNLYSTYNSVTTMALWGSLVRVAYSSFDNLQIDNLAAGGSIPVFMNHYSQMRK